ncbi:hypothetical protein B0H12DRAFT_282742 [Mycena haematopus]|nr:hypothetical protein B0H12DRAFT_282742 [Mycena haematopus]
MTRGCPEADGSFSSSGKTCYRCGSVGHLTRDCQGSKCYCCGQATSCRSPYPGAQGPGLLRKRPRTTSLPSFAPSLLR